MLYPEFSDSVLLQISGQPVSWPRDCDEILEIEIAKKIVESELLVQEDQVVIRADQSPRFSEVTANLVLLTQNGGHK